MNLNILKFKKNKVPSVGSLRSNIFDTHLYWFSVLCLSLCIIIVTAFIGFKLFYSVYSESYKEDDMEYNIEEIIDLRGLTNTLKERNDFLIKERDLPEDPAI